MILTALWFCGDDWVAAVTHTYWIGHIPFPLALGAEIIFWALIARGVLRSQ